MAHTHSPAELGSAVGPAFERRRSSGLRLGALAGAVSCGRLHLREVLWEWKLTEIADDAELVASELLTNAVRASRRPDGPVPAISLRLHTDDTSLLIEVGDHNAEEPALMHSDNDAIGGRGLLLVNALSARWGWQFTGYSHKTVWAVLDSSQKPDQDQ